MFIYSMRSIQICSFQPKSHLPRLFQHFGFSLDHHARSRSHTWARPGFFQIEIKICLYKNTKFASNLPTHEKDMKFCDKFASTISKSLHHMRHRRQRVKHFFYYYSYDGRSQHPADWFVTLWECTRERSGFTRGTYVPSTCYRARTAPGFLDSPVVT